MSVFRRLINNTILAFISTALVKVSNSILFIMIGRRFTPTEAGSFSLGIAYFTVILALSAWGLHELLVREVTPRLNKSGQYFINFLFIRIVLAFVFYALLLGFLKIPLPYTDLTKDMIRIVGLTIFSESIFSICQSLFIAHENLFIPTLGAVINSIFTIFAGLWFLNNGNNIVSIAWAMPIGSLSGLVVFPLAIVKLFQSHPQTAPMKLDWQFSLMQLRSVSGFVLLSLFAILSFQADTFLLSFFLEEEDLGYYGAAQTILMGFLMLPMAIRTSIYPLMSKYRHSSEAKLQIIYQKLNQYLVLVGLPIAMGITLIARELINTMFGVSFSPAVKVLQIAIWSVLFLFITVPSARMLLVYDYQKNASYIRGFSMLVSVALNLWLIPNYGIVGASIARVIASIIYFLCLYHFVQKNILPKTDFFAFKSIFSTIIMAFAVWLVRDNGLVLPILVGITSYTLMIIILKAVNQEDMHYIRNLI